jgi:DNA anti-recombination protein RmuC
MAKPQQMDKPDDDDLPENRKAAVAHGLAQYQRLAQQCDEVIGESARLKTELAGLKVVAEALKSQLNEAESRLHSAYAVRDQAVDQRAVYESLFISVQAMLRAHSVPNAPMIRESEADVINGRA